MKKNKIKFVKIELYLHAFFSNEKLTNMKNNLKELFITILLLLSFLPNNEMEATHVMGADITYRILDTSANNRRYLITLTRYRYCGGINYSNNNLTLILPGSTPNTVSIPTIAPNIGGVKEVTPLCDVPDVAVKTQTHCPGPNTPEINGIKGVMREIRTAEITVGKRGWIFVGYNECCRNSITTAPGGPNFWIQCGINTDYVNNSTIFTADPVPYWCKGRVNCYSHAPVDTFDEILFGSKYITIGGQSVLRDSISFQRYVPWQANATLLFDLANGNNVPVTLAAGINAEQFLYTKPGTGGVRMDPISGEICAWPQDMDQDAIMAMMVWEWRAEPRAGGGYQRTRIGYVCRDLQFSVRSNCLGATKEGVLDDSTLNVNTFSTDKNYIEICGSRSGYFTFKGVGPVAQNMQMKQVTPTPSDILGAKFTVTKVRGNNVDTVYGRFQFDSTKGSGNVTMYFDFYYCNSIGIKVSESYPINIVYVSDVWFEQDTLTYCIGGDAIRLTPKGAKKFSWTPKTGIVAAGPDSSWVDVRPNTGTRYSARGLDLDAVKSCNVFANIFVKSIQPFTYSIQPGKNIEACLGDSIPIVVQPDNSQSPYTYTWTGTGSSQLYNRTNQSRGTNINNPYIWANVTGPLNLRMESRFGCVLRDTIQFNLRGARHQVDALTNKTFVCKGDTVNLSASIIPSKTGPSIYKSSSDNRIVNMAQATSAEYPPSGCSGTGCYPNVFGVSGLGASSTTRVLYRASDITLQGGRAGIIRSITMNIINVAVSSFDGLEIKMGSINTNTINNSTNVALHTVYNEKAITCVSGLNTYTLDRAFDWDGKSNIVVEFCIRRNQSASGMNRYRVMDGASNNLVTYKFSNIAGQLSCQSSDPFINPTGVSISRPWIRFAMTGVDSSDNQFTSTWTPTSIIKRLLASPRAVGAPSYEDTVFRIQYGSNICFGNDTVVVKVDTNFRVRATASKNVVCRPAGGPVTPVNLTAAVTSNQPFTLSWRSNDPGFGTPTITNPTASPSTTGTFMYIARIQNLPCVSEDTTYITVEDSLKFTFNTKDPSCSASNGEVSIVYPSGTDSSKYTVLWTPLNSTNHVQKNLAVGQYRAQLTLKSDVGCKGSGIANLTAINIPLNVSIVSAPIKCFGGTSDSIVATASATLSPGPYSYSWGTHGNTQKITGKVAGSYTVTATDNITGCTGTQSVNVAQPTAITTNVVKNDVLCHNEANGFIRVVPSGGTPSNLGFYSYNWISSNGLNTSKFIQFNNEQYALFADSIIYEVTDVNGCVFRNGTRINQPNAPLNPVFTVVNATVVNGTDGKIIINTSGGTPAYRAKLFRRNAGGAWIQVGADKVPLNSLDSFIGLSKNEYKIDVLDANNCLKVDSFMVRDVVCDIKVNLTTTNIECFGATTGSISLGAKDELNAPTTNLYTYSIRKPGGPQFLDAQSKLVEFEEALFSNLGAGVYAIRIQTNKGCDTIVPNITLTQNPDIIINLTKQINPSCATYTDGQVKVEVTDNFPPYEYNFGTGFSNIDSINSLASGVYNHQVRNNLGCVKGFSYTLTDPMGVTSVNTTIDSSISCFGGSNAQVTLDPVPGIVGPFSYINKPGTETDSTSPVLKGLNAGSKSVDIWYKPDVNSVSRCLYTHTFRVNEPTLLELDLTSVRPVNCFGDKNGQIILNSRKNSVLTGTAPHTYTIKHIVNNTTVSQLTNVTFNNLAPGTYSAEVIDKNGCKATLTPNVTVGEPDKFYGHISTTPSSCVESNNGGYVIDATKFVGGNVGNYVRSVSLFNNINNYFSSTPTANNLPTTATNSNSFYRVTIFDSKSCRWDSTFTIDTVYKLRFSRAILQTEIDSVSCYGGNDGAIRFNPLTLTPQNAPFNYVWNGVENTNNATYTTSAGTHTLVVTDVNGCIASIKADVEEPLPITIVGKVEDVNCFKGNDGNIKVGVRGGRGAYTILWENPPIMSGDSISGLEAGYYTSYVTDEKGCTAEETFLVQQPDSFVVRAQEVNHITCFNANNGSIKLFVKGGAPDFKYTWNADDRNSPNIDNLKPNAAYKVTVTDSKNCEATTTVEIKEPTKLEIESIKLDDLLCPRSNDGKIEVNAKGGTFNEIEQYSYSIDNGSSYVYTNTFGALKPGNYTVIVKDINGCTALRQVTINEPEELFVKALKDNTIDTIKMGESIQLTYTQNTVSGTIPIVKSIQWTPSELLSCSNCQTTMASPYETTNYTVNVFYHNNCLATSSVRVPVHLPADFYVPTAFSPGNQDGVNDILKLFGNGIKQVELRIFNRWGEKVFETTTIGQGWDGSYKGEMQPTGVYTYSAKVVYLNNHTTTKQGNFTLIR